MPSYLEDLPKDMFLLICSFLECEDCRKLIFVCTKFRKLLDEYERPNGLVSTINHGEEVDFMVVSSNKKMVAVISHNLIKIWSLETEKCLFYRRSMVNNITAMSFFDKDKKIVFTLSNKYCTNILEYWDIKKRKFLDKTELNELIGIITAIYILPKLEIVISKDEYAFYIWKSDTGNVDKYITSDRIIDIILSPDKNRIITLLRSGRISVWIPQISTPLHSYPPFDHFYPFFEPRELFNLSHRNIYVSFLNNYTIAHASSEIVIFNSNMQRVMSFSREDEINGILPISNGKEIVTAYTNGMLRIWSVKTGKCLFKIRTYQQQKCLTLISNQTNDKKIITALFNGTLNIWNLNCKFHK